MLKIFILLLLSTAPPFLFLFYIFKRDCFEPEPGELVWKVFKYGALMVIPAGFLEIIPLKLYPNPGLYDPVALFFWAFIHSFVFIGPIEEYFKWLAVKYSIWDDKNFNEPLDGIVYFCAASMGFAAFENVAYVFQHGFGTGLIRAVTAIPLHAFAGIFFGYYAGLSRFASKEESSRVFFKGFLFAVLFHAIYDCLLLSSIPLAAVAIFPLLIGASFIAKTQMERLILVSKQSFGQKPEETALADEDGAILAGSAIASSRPISVQVEKTEWTLGMKIASAVKTLVLAFWGLCALIVIAACVGAPHQAHLIIVGFLVISTIPLTIFAYIRFFFS
ncbi:PrsW family intramembrane metalloprotease [Candidatus Riflebacteria bacterium]